MDRNKTGLTKEELEIELMLEEDMGRFYYDAEGFADYAFEWGVGELKGRTLRKWQRQFLRDFSNELRQRDFDGVNPVDPTQFSTASGHGIGKSALVAIIILFIMSTRPHCRGIVSANTMPQLQTKTWAELGKWHKRCITGHWFTWKGSKGGLCFYENNNPESWRVDGQTCKEENSESFAGLHAADSTPFYIFDEASAIPDKIFEVASGGLTDGEPVILLFGNPTRNSGYFRYTHGKYKHRWNCRQIDSRDVEGTNKQLFEKWIEDYGEDSDYVRVRVRGMFPRASSMQFISTEDVARAMEREEYYDFHDPLIVGIDLSRGGEDDTVLYPRRGMDARSLPFVRIPGEQTRDTEKLLSFVTTKLNEWQPDAIFVDVGMIGGAFGDRLRKLGYNAIDVGFGHASPDKHFANMSALMLHRVNEAIKAGLALPFDTQLEEELTCREFWHDARDRVVLESKSDMKGRGLMSPNIVDGLSLTFAMPVQKQQDIATRNLPGAPARPPVNHVSEQGDSLV